MRNKSDILNRSWVIEILIDSMNKNMLLDIKSMLFLKILKNIITCIFEMKTCNEHIQIQTWKTCFTINMYGGNK